MFVSVHNYILQIISILVIMEELQKFATYFYTTNTLS